MRNIAAFPSAVPQATSSRVSREYEFRAITPVFGAGVVARTPDENTPVRGTTVRGHLRYWWRATRGRQFQDSEIDKLQAEEFKIWGDTTHPSKIGVEVVECSGSKANCAEFLEKNRDLVYALFPFNKSNKAAAADYWPKLTFRVRVDYPAALERDAEAALWAWANFGGVGSRTRRGCGALYCQKFAPPASAGLTAWVQQKLGSYLHYTDGDFRDWAMVFPPIVNAARGGDPQLAWATAIRLLADFRQLPPVGRRGKVGDARSYSRSYWPEADSLRAITRRGIADHMNVLTTTEAFPRAELGLPYLIKFTRKTLDSPNDCAIYPLNSERTASPIILKPLAFGDGRNAVPSVQWTSRYTLPGVRIKFEDHGIAEVTTGPNSVARPNLATYPNSPMRSTASGSALDAFILFAEGKGYKY